MRSRTRLIAALFLAFFLLTSAVAQTAPPADLDAWVTRAMKEFEVPGVAVAIVKDGKMVFAKGYGVRSLGDPKPVDEHTLFGIASNSKAFTAAALAMLVDEGKVSWDDPVQKYLPSFQVHDPYVTREITVRDLLSHRAGLGLGAGDLLFWPDTDVSRDQVVSAVRYIRPESSFRSQYAYNNLMFVVAGQVIAHVSGKPWEQFIAERIFTPLGMTETRVGALTVPGINFASPHSRGWRQQGTLVPVTLNRDEVWAAAAGIRANVVDLSKWMTVQLNGGKLADSKRLWSEATARQMWSPQTIVPIGDPPPALKATKPMFSAYCLGWTARDYRGHRVISHGGGLTGMVTTVQMIPELNLGVVVLTNQEATGAYASILYHIFDHYLNLPPTDWITAYHGALVDTLAKAHGAEKKLDDVRVPNTKPSLELAKYAREYRDDWYGKVDIKLQDGKLMLTMPHAFHMTAELEHWHYDTFRARFTDPTVPDAFVTFTLTRDGGIDTMTMQAVSSLADFSFDYQDLLFKPVAKSVSQGE
jgi:CubicO group peptidase (beta-lactamase class C family)